MEARLITPQRLFAPLLGTEWSAITTHLLAIGFLSKGSKRGEEVFSNPVPIQTWNEPHSRQSLKLMEDRRTSIFTRYKNLWCAGRTLHKLMLSVFEPIQLIINLIDQPGK